MKIYNETVPNLFDKYLSKDEKWLQEYRAPDGFYNEGITNVSYLVNNGKFLNSIIVNIGIYILLWTLVKISIFAIGKKVYENDYKPGFFFKKLVTTKENYD